MSDADLSPAIPARAGQAGASPDLMVQALNQDRLLQGGRTYRIGRDPESDITIDDPRVSWAHGVFRVEGASWVLEDLGSSNGTFLGPDRTQRVEIAGACEVRLGHRDNGPVVRLQPQQLTAVAAPRAPESGVTGGARAGSSAPTATPREPTLPGAVTRMKPGVADRPTSAAGQGPRVSAGETVPHRRHRRYLRGSLKLALKGPLAWIGVGCFEILTLAAAVEIGDNGKVPRGGILNPPVSAWALPIVLGQIIVLIVLPSVHRRSRPKNWKCGEYGEREKDFPVWMARAAAALFALIPLTLRGGCGVGSAAGQCVATPFHEEGWVAAVSRRWSAWPSSCPSTSPSPRRSGSTTSGTCGAPRRQASGTCGRRSGCSRPPSSPGSGIGVALSPNSELMFGIEASTGGTGQAAYQAMQDRFVEG